MKTLISKLLGVSKTFLDILWPILTKKVGASLSVLLPIALMIVKELAKNGNLTNAEKRQDAFVKLTDAVKKEGLSVSTSVLNLAIEMAVTSFKSSTEK